MHAVLFQLTGTEHRISTAYHPQTNGLVERYNQTLQRSLIKLCNDKQNDWDDHLDLFSLLIGKVNAVFKEYRPLLFILFFIHVGGQNF